MQNYSLWIFSSLWSVMTFAQLGVHGDIMLNSSLALVGVDLHFETGVLRGQAEQAEVLFLNGAQTRGGAINTHSEVALRTVNSTRFDFPSGKQGVYLPFSLSANTAVTVSGELIAATPSSLVAAPSKISMDSNYYWSLQGQGEAQLEFFLEFYPAILQELDQGEQLKLMGFTGQAWEEIPGFIQSNSLRTENAIALEHYTAYALGSAAISTALTPAQAITPNGDGINDRWIIANNALYPNAKIWVFNRWGEEVFYSAGNYQNNWGGNSQ